MNLHQLKDDLCFMLRNETDGFLATTLVPMDTGLSAYIIFNCYGCYYAAGNHLLIPKKHRRMIVEVAKDIGGSFNWNETIPVSVSDSPKILLTGKRLRQARSAFSAKEWREIFRFIKKNQKAIAWHWVNGSSFALLEEFGLVT